jgi:hypothetical protein
VRKPFFQHVDHLLHSHAARSFDQHRVARPKHRAHEAGRMESIRRLDDGISRHPGLSRSFGKPLAKHSTGDQHGNPPERRVRADLTMEVG